MPTVQPKPAALARIAHIAGLAWLLSTAAACEGKERRAADAGAPAPPPTWSHGGSAAAPPSPVIEVADADALREIVAATPRASGSAGPAASLVGVDTGIPRRDGPAGASAKAPEPAAPGSAPARASEVEPLVTLGRVGLAPKAAEHVIEREARAQLYHRLVTRCRDEAGAILPPEVVKLVFWINPEGYISVSTIDAVASEPKFQPSAECMRRELSASTFRLPPGARGGVVHVAMTVPSVD